MKKLNRREFISKTSKTALGIGIASQLGILSGCDSSSNTNGPSEAAWRQFAASLSGMLLRPGDALYAQTALPHNLAFVSILPQGIVIVANEADVQKCIKFVIEHNLPFAARSGNHSYAAYSSTTGLQIDLTSLNSVELDTSTGILNVGGGTLLGNLVSEVTPSGFMIPVGTCATVGLAGLLLGGGIGFNGRRFGLTSDNLVQTQIVTASGEILNCNDAENSDLFWAVRGSGGGNFGIHTGFQIQAHEVGNVSVYEIAWDATDIGQVWLSMQDIALSASDEFSLKLAISISEEGPLPGSQNISFTATGQYYGTAEDLRELLDPAFSAAKPTSSTIEELSFFEAQLFLEEHGGPNAFLTKSAFIEGKLSESAVSTLVNHLSKWPANSRLAEFKIFAFGEAYGAMDPDATAFFHRSADFVVESCASWHPGDSQSIIDASTGWLQELFVLLDSSFNGFAYNNFMDPTLEDWDISYHSSNLPRLISVNKKHDPENLFDFDQGVPLVEL